MPTKKLNDGSLHLLRLTARGAGLDGWAPVSKVVWPLIAQLPDDLVEKRPSDDGGHARLTDRGDAIVVYT